MYYTNGSQVSSSGDVVVKDTSHHSKFFVRGSDNFQDVVSSKHSAFSVDSSRTTTTEFGREVREFNLSLGKYAIGFLREAEEISETLSCVPGSTQISSDGVTATFAKGLSFDSDDSAIYFGESRTFRIKFFANDLVPRLLFQYLDPASNEYKTKLSCTK